MISHMRAKLNIRIKVNGMLKAQKSGKGLGFDRLVALLSLDTGFKEATILKVLEQMEMVGECKCDIKNNVIKKK